MDTDGTRTATVQVWVVPLVVPARELASLLASLSPAEWARAGRYRLARDARRFSLGRAWLRRVLAAQLRTCPGDVDLVDGPGKPRLAAGAGPCFNLSHAADLAVIAVAGREVGVDVEHRDSGRHAVEAATVACSPAERAALDGPDAFLRCWTAKEAYLKARGVGLAVAPDRVGVGAGTPSPVRMTGDPGPPRWWARPLVPARDYVGAVVAEGTDWSVELRTTADLP